MRPARALWLLGLSIACSGCALVEDSCHNFVSAVKSPIESHLENSRNRKWADDAWNQLLTSPVGHNRSEDYALGFKDGFAEYLYRGGDGEPPLMAPSRYRDIHYQCPQGYASVQDWFNGYRYGAALARDSGARKWITIHASLGTEVEGPAPHMVEPPIQPKTPLAQQQPPLAQPRPPAALQPPPVAQQQAPPVAQQQTPPVAQLQAPPAAQQQALPKPMPAAINDKDQWGQPVTGDVQQQKPAPQPKLNVLPDLSNPSKLPSAKDGAGFESPETGWLWRQMTHSLFLTNTESDSLPEVVKVKISAISLNEAPANETKAAPPQVVAPLRPKMEEIGHASGTGLGQVQLAQPPQAPITPAPAQPTAARLDGVILGTASDLPTVPAAGQPPSPPNFAPPPMPNAAPLMVPGAAPPAAVLRVQALQEPIGQDDGSVPVKTKILSITASPSKQ